MRPIKSRREFLTFLGQVGVGYSIAPALMISCGNVNRLMTQPACSEADKERLSKVKLKGIKPTDKDDLVLAKGVDSELLIRWNTPINKYEKFGYNNDFTCFIPLKDDDDSEGLLWVNHEYTNPLFVSNFDFRNPELERKKEQVDEEMKSVGGSIIHIKKENGKWTFVPDSEYNRRVDAHTKIPFNWDEEILGSSFAIGTHSNCSGGITPWGTILTCEENYDMCYGESIYSPSTNERTHKDSALGWEKFHPHPPEHFGWVVEVDPKTGNAQKHVALGRFSHECCTLVELEDGRLVAYSGDDKNNEFIYKFISAKPGSLKEGTLYVANMEFGKWIALDFDAVPFLQLKFSSQTEVLVRAREAARMLGATPQNRPEDIEIDPLTGHVIIALTNNVLKDDYHGSMLKIVETDGKYDSLTFTSETMLTGGEETGFSCPDNLMFDKAGNLWFSSDISGLYMNRPEGPYQAFKNNGLFVLIRHGKDAGKIIQIASAPTDAELTGPWFSPDYKSLFLSVQHPGELSPSLEDVTSTWPHDKDGIPKPTVVVLEGPLIDKLNYLDQM